jgi:hypothetical protein
LEIATGSYGLAHALKMRLPVQVEV